MQVTCTKYDLLSRHVWKVLILFPWSILFMGGLIHKDVVAKDFEGTILLK